MSNTYQVEYALCENIAWGSDGTALHTRRGVVMLHSTMQAQGRTRESVYKYLLKQWEGTLYHDRLIIAIEPKKGR